MDSAADAFTKILGAEIQTAEELLACLQHEQQALQQLDTEALERQIADKVELLIHMHQHASERAALLEQAGYSTETERVEAFIAHQANQAQPLWKRLMELAGELDKQNRINGSVIQLSQQRTQMALDLITRPEDKSRTYGKQGYTDPGPSSFSRDKA